MDRYEVEVSANINGFKSKMKEASGEAKNLAQQLKVFTKGAFVNDQYIDIFSNKISIASGEARNLGNSFKLVKPAVEQASNGVKRLDTNIKQTSNSSKVVGNQIANSFNKGLRSVKRLTLGFIGARSLFALFRQQVNAYRQENEVFNQQMQISTNIITTALAPAFEFFGNVVLYATVGLAKLIDIMFGTNITSKVLESGLQKANNQLADMSSGMNDVSDASKEMKENLLGIDEITNLEQEGTGTGLLGGIGKVGDLSGIQAQFDALDKLKKAMKDVDDFFNKHWLGKTLKGLANFGKETGKSGIKGLANVGKAASAEAGGLRGLASGVSSQVGGIRGLTSGAVGAMKATFSPSALKGGFKDIGKGLKGGGTLMKGIGRVGGAALMALGPALAFADKASELNPFEGPHYNEDGTEKKALQATGEVVGTTAGALGGVAGGLEGAAAGALVGQALIPIPGVGAAIGAVAGGIAGGWLGDTIFQPIGEAIGGTIGWLGDNLLGGIQDVAGTVWDGLTGAAGGVWDAVSGAASGVWDFLTGGENSDKPVGGLLGLTPIGMGINAAAGIGEWLFGGENDPYQNVQTQGNEGNKKAKQGSGNTIIIKNININTEDDPEKIKSALMNLIIEMQEQIAPRQVSRTVGEPPSQSTSTTQNENNTPQAEGTDAQSGEQNGDQNNNPTT